jgi:hypothetical protein
VNLKEDILTRFSGKGPGHPIFMPDLTLWYPWHRTQGTLPEGWQDYSMTRAAQVFSIITHAFCRLYKDNTQNFSLAIILVRACS